MPDDLRVKTLEANFEHRGLALLLDPLQDLLSGLGHDLFDARWMDAAVDDELVQRHPCHLAAHRVESADDHRLGRVIHDEVDSSRLLQGSDVAAFLADDPSFELIGRQRQHRNRDLGGLVGGDPLDRLGDDLSCAALAFVASGQL